MIQIFDLNLELCYWYCLSMTRTLFIAQLLSLKGHINNFHNFTEKPQIKNLIFAKIFEVFVKMLINKSKWLD